MRRSESVLPSAEDAAPFFFGGGGAVQVLDWCIVHGENALCFDAQYAAGIAAIANYGGAVPAAASKLDGSH